MADTKLISPGIPNYTLKRNLRLNDNYISNDGGDEGIKVTDAGLVELHTVSGVGAVHNFGTGSYTLKSWADTDDYFKISITSDGITTISTVDDSGNNEAKMVFEPQGDLFLTPAVNKELKLVITTKTASGTNDSTFRLTETLNLSSGAGGSDVHYGIWYAQTQTDLTGWDDVYLMYLSNGSNKFKVDKDAQPIIDINDTATTTTTNKGLHIDIDSSGALAGGSQTLTNIGLDLDINRADTVSHASATVNQIGIDVDIVGDPDGTATNTGLDINLSGNTTGDTNTGITITVADADTNYALVTESGVVVLKDALWFTQTDGNEFIDSQNDGYLDIGATTAIRLEAPTLCEDKLYFTQTDGNEFIDSQNDGYLDIGATTAIRLEQDTLIEGTKKLYFNDAGGEYISGDGTDLTITSGRYLGLSSTNFTTTLDSGAGGDGNWNGLKFAYDSNKYSQIKIHDDGMLKIESVTDSGSADIILDAATDIRLQAAGGDVFLSADVGITTSSILFAVGNVPAGMKINANSGNDYFNLFVEEYGETTFQTLHGDGSLAHLNIDIDGHVEFDGCAVGFDLETPTYHGTNTNVSFIVGNKQFFTFGAGDVTNLNLIFPETSGNFVLLLKQDGTGSRTVTNYLAWDLVNDDAADGSATVKFPSGNNPTLTTDANHVDIISFFWDADNQIAYGVASLDFQF